MSSFPYINIAEGKCYLQITGKGTFKWTNYGEQCDDCGNDQFELTKSSNGLEVLTCSKCKTEYTIHNTNGSAKSATEETTMAKATAPVKKPVNRVKAVQPGKPALAKSPAAGPKRERLGIRPAIKAALTKDPTRGVKFAVLLANLKAAFPKMAEAKLAGKITRHRSRLERAGVKVSPLAGAPEGRKAKDDLGL